MTDAELRALLDDLVPQLVEEANIREACMRTAALSFTWPDWIGFERRYKLDLLREEMRARWGGWWR